MDEYAEDVRGRSLHCDHYLPEERPDLVVSALRNSSARVRRHSAADVRRWLPAAAADDNRVARGWGDGAPGDRVPAA